MIICLMSQGSETEPEAYDQKMYKGWQSDLVGKDICHLNPMVWVCSLDSTVEGEKQLRHAVL